MRLGLSVPKILKETFAELRKAVKWARSCRSLRRVLRSAKWDEAHYRLAATRLQKNHFWVRLLTYFKNDLIMHNST